MTSLVAAMPDSVYLLHFSQPIRPAHTTRHYLGYAKNLKKRIQQHREGKGSRLCQVALERGIGFEVAQV
jgi:predicted GIY-YIG superfamily endonuclease